MSQNVNAPAGRPGPAATAKPTASRSTPPGGSARPRRLTASRLLLLVALALVLLSGLRQLTGAGDLTGSGQYGAALAAAVPIGLAGLGGLWAERSGVVNIGLEGMMMLGSFAAGWMGWQHGPWVAVLAGIVGGALGGLLHALVTVTFGVDQIISGVALNIVAQGLTEFLGKLWFGADGSAGAHHGGTDKSSPVMADMPSFTIPGLSPFLASVEHHHWFLVSDTAGVLGGLVTQVSWLTVCAVALFAVSYFVLWRTPFGLRLRSCGENPTAAESLGVRVYFHKYAAVTVSGALAGLGGAFLAISVHIWQDGQTGGRGYIGLATMIFGNWRPGGVAMGAGLFGFMDALQLRGGGPVVHALLLLLAVGLLALGLWKLRAGARVRGTVGLVVAALLALWYFTTDTVPLELVSVAPYVATLLVLSLASQRLRMPAADGKPYRKGQST